MILIGILWIINHSTGWIRYPYILHAGRDMSYKIIRLIFTVKGIFWLIKSTKLLILKKYIFINDWIMEENMEIRPEKLIFTLAHILDLQWNYFLNKILRRVLKKYLIFYSKLNVFETKVFEWLNCNDFYHLNII